MALDSRGRVRWWGGRRQVRRGQPVFVGGPVREVASPEERQRVIAQDHVCVIASSGMLTGGPSAFYAVQIAGDSRATVMITGYQDEESPGRRLFDLAERGEGELELEGRLVQASCSGGVARGGRRLPLRKWGSGWQGRCDSLVPVPVSNLEPPHRTCAKGRESLFQPALPVSRVLQDVHNRVYVLPAIQREFVWRPEQIRRLFDSVMRGYPIGSFLFWKVDAQHASDFTFYEFVSDYHERNNPYAPVAHIPPGQGVVAILDGQQRLTALNVGLYGSHAERQPRKWWNNPDAFPRKRLYLNLTGSPAMDESELDMAYDFRFLTDDEASPRFNESASWFRVGDVLQLGDSGPAIMAELERRQLSGSGPFKVLYDLYHSVREKPAINAYLEESQDPNKVLQIFVRVNSGGTTLSYSDLLLSMATNQWKELDAREQVRTLVQELNTTPATFMFSKDFVLKAGLVLIDVPDIGFKVSNFTRANMAEMEAAWMNIRSTLLRTADLVASFGFSGRTLSADSALIPIAYYLHHHRQASNYVTSAQSAADRDRIRRWLTRSLMKRGIWGSGLDTLLNRLREKIRLHGAVAFPVDEMEETMTAVGKSLRFENAEIAELLDLRYGSPRTFPVLATLYPGLDLTKSFHEDHIFPKSRFTRSRLSAAGVPPALIDDYVDRADALPNLQLLGHDPNNEKRAKLPTEWLSGPYFTSDEQRQTYILENDLLDLPDDIVGFLDFYNVRRSRLEQRLRQTFGVAAEPATTDP